MTTNDLKKLRSKLPNGWASQIAKQLSLTPDQVRKVIRGDSNNDKVIATCIRLANKKKYDDEVRCRQLANL